jgi:hypothetical protein
LLRTKGTEISAGMGMRGSFALCLIVSDGIAQNAIRPHPFSHGSCGTETGLEEQRGRLINQFGSFS